MPTTHLATEISCVLNAHYRCAFSTPGRQRHSQSSYLHTALSTVIKNVKRRKERERFCFSSTCKNRFALSSCGVVLSATASRAVGWVDKTQWIEGKTRPREKDQNPGQIHQASACGGRGGKRQKGGIITMQSRDEGSAVLPPLLPSSTTTLPWANAFPCSRGSFILVRQPLHSKTLGSGQRMGNPAANQGLRNA